MNQYKTTVGLEVHVELQTKSKMFCGCKNDPHASLPNTNVCPVCMAHPGTLPVVNKEAVLNLFKVGTAIGGTLAEYSEFDRKNYFYPDIPKAYQISQYKYPFVSGGTIAGVKITRIHLEEDTARSQHDQGDESLVDFNRAGVPLMELVTEPVIHDAESAVSFAKELQLLLRSLEVSAANMEKGEMRVEANISVSKDDSLGTKVEVKNLNSFKAVENAIKYETKRHIELLESGGLVVQETRGWDESKSKTFSQRAKENANDYRYFPDPDIPKFKRSDLTDFQNSSFNEIVNKTPTFKRDLYQNLGINSAQVEIIIAEPTRDSFFRKALEGGVLSGSGAQLAANYFTSDLMSLLDAKSLDIASGSSDNFAKLIGLLLGKKVTSRVAKDLLEEVVFGQKDPLELAESRGLLQSDNQDLLLPIIAGVIAEHATVAEEYQAGKETALQFLIGQVMKATRGSADPAIVKEILIRELKT